jgi:DNA-binding MarR family transcriptional regulator
MVDHSQYNEGQLLAHVGHAYRMVAEASMQSIGLRRTQVMLLMQVYKQEGVTQIELAERLSLNGATVSEMLQRLEDMQLIVRQRDAEDRRLVRVYLTDDGREKQMRIQHQLQILEQTIFEGVDPEQRLVLRQLLQHVLRNMAAAHENAQCCRE